MVSFRYHQLNTSIMYIHWRQTKYPNSLEDNGRMVTRRMGLNGNEVSITTVCIYIHEHGHKQCAQGEIGTLQVYTHSQKFR